MHVNIIVRGWNIMHTWTHEILYSWMIEYMNGNTIPSTQPRVESRNVALMQALAHAQEHGHIVKDIRDI
jgi:hypothetical protein